MDIIILASTIVGSAVPSQSEPEYWLTQQRLLPHVDRCIRFLQKLNTQDETGCSGSNDTFHNLGDLCADQGKMAEAEEKMYQRALEGKQKARGPEPISTPPATRAFFTKLSWCDTSQVTSLVSYAIADRRQPLNPLRIWRCPHSFWFPHLSSCTPSQVTYIDNVSSLVPCQKLRARWWRRMNKGNRRPQSYINC